MHIGYIVPKANSINDILWIDTMMQNVTRHARKAPVANQSILKVLEGRMVQRCYLCDREGNTEVHHVKPVWAITVDYLLCNFPCTHQELYERARPAYYEDFDFSSWHDPKNMRVLCSLCHLEQQKKDDDLWRRILSPKYRLIYSKKWALKAPTKQPDFGLYVDSYMDDVLAAVNL